MPSPTPFAALTESALCVGPVAVHHAADILVWVATVTVPAVLLWHARRQPRPVRRVLSTVAVFAAAAGIVQGLRALPAWDARSWAGAGVAVAAAVIGWGAVVSLVRRLPRAARATGWEAREEDLKRLGLLEAAVTASGDGVMIATAGEDGAPQIVYANPAFERIMGYTAEEALGLSPSVFCHTDSAVRRFGDGELVPDPETQADEESLRAIRTALQGASSVRMELPGRRKDGTRVWAEWQLVPVADAAGGATHWVAILRDTTERRQLEEQLRESQKMDAIGRLAGGIAHDFNNLLTVIRGNAEILSELGPELADTTELVDDIRGAAERAAGLVRQLLTFGRRQPARPEVVNLNVVVSEMAGLLRRLLGERVTVVTNFAPVPVRARVDRGQFEQVVMNLAVNARDAMPRGGTLTISTAAVVEPKGAGSTARFARLTVSDTGTGMTPDVRARIFEPFFTTKAPGKGTGLGLATVYGIVTQADGRIGIDSAVGVGTAFRVDLPWCDEAPGSSTSAAFAVPQTARERKVGRGRSVLLVEDEEAVRKLARATLEGCGYAVTEAMDAETALGLLGPGTALDALVTDLTMPGMGGRELAGRVRELRPDVGVVFISGYAPDAGWLDGIPGSVFLAKPFTPGDLLKATGRALNRAERAAVARA